LTRSNSKYPWGLLSSAGRRLSVRSGTPPACSILIAIDVPDLGSPETTMIGFPYRILRDSRSSALTRVLRRQVAGCYVEVD